MDGGTKFTQWERKIFHMEYIEIFVYKKAGYDRIPFLPFPRSAGLDQFEPYFDSR